MAWFVFNRDSARSLQKSLTISKDGIQQREGNALTEALRAQESILLLPGTIAGSPFLLHIQNSKARAAPSSKKKRWW